MRNGNILFIDNDKLFLETRTIYLERAGYKVFPAYTLEEAEEKLNFHFIQLIIVDVRAIDDDDIHDKSGIDFAHKSKYASIPKIILTAEPSVSDQRKVLVGSSKSNWVAAARDYLAKADGAEEMVRTVKHIFKEYVALNQELKTSWKQLSAVELLGQIEPDLGEQEIGERLSEINALFKIMFNKFAYVSISQLLPEAKKSPKLLAYAENANGHVDKYFVEIGRSCAIKRVIEKYDTALLYNRFKMGVFITEKSLEGMTSRYGAVGWKFRGIGPSQYFVTFKTMMRNRTEDEIKHIMKRLFEDTIAPWQSVVETEEAQLVDLFLHHSDLSAGRLTKAAHMIKQQAAVLNMPCLSVGSDGVLNFQFDDEGIASPPPQNLDILVANVAKKTITLNLKKGVIHNNLGRESIFFDHEGKGWLTGFGEAEFNGFLLADAVTFAQNLRSDWAGHISPADWYQYESIALRRQIDRRLEVDNPFWGKMIAILEAIQACAEATDGLIGNEFLAAMFWANIQKLSGLKEHHLRACDEVQGGINLLISTVLIGNRLLNKVSSKGMEMTIDHANQAAIIGQNHIELTPQEYNLLCYMHAYANQAVTRLDLANNVFGANYEIAPSEKDFIEYNRITMTLKRLREKIDEDGSLGLISTVRGKGYRLNLPKQD